ncbi:B12-binding domain-containing radical SAM protein [Pararhodospirillum oryzae]|uniref:Uncharacterized protein n=1 Tax=Pararhodospirillum oryzae TaxID=478448 RepID=A0A512HBF6_9PROT|nr:radical SAM protein [Pararhodospirillum oryzae]GEO82772.1 hypothetical protein ROR02_29030 [Pararhodospirillum oryzae]
MAFRILLVYPSLFMQTGIPLSIATLAGAAREAGLEVRLFDPFLYRLMQDDIDESELRAGRHHSTLPVDYGAKGVAPLEGDPRDALTDVIHAYQPHLIGMSAVESTFERGCLLTRHLKTVTDVPVIGGGVFPTLAPEIAIQEPSLDMLCVGEGESTLVEVARRLIAGQPYDDVKGLWVKRPDGSVARNARRLECLDTLARPDFSVFPEATFLRPMRGNLFRTLPVEFSRGCPYQCAFCAEPALDKVFRAQGETFFRKKSMDRILEELHHNVAHYRPEFFYFGSETFLAMSRHEFDAFIEGYADIRLPFWIQTRPETITREAIERLREVGLFWMTIGVEHGNEAFRARVLRRRTRNQQILDVLAMLDAIDFGASVNLIMGYPHETRELVEDTVRFSHQMHAVNHRVRCSISIFSPFRGSELYDVAVAGGYWDPRIPYISGTNISTAGYLTNPDLPSDVLAGLYRAFPLYTYLPESEWPRVREAEALTPEGDALYEALNTQVARRLAEDQKPPVCV